MTCIMFVVCFWHIGYAGQMVSIGNNIVAHTFLTDEMYKSTWHKERVCWCEQLFTCFMAGPCTQVYPSTEPVCRSNTGLLHQWVAFTATLDWIHIPQSNFTPSWCTERAKPLPFFTPYHPNVVISPFTPLWLLVSLIRHFVNCIARIAVVNKHTDRKTVHARQV